MSDLTHIIYALCDPENDEIRYVGKSNVGLKRPNQHRLPSQLKQKTKKNEWIKGLLSRELIPKIKILQICLSISETENEEIRWIRLLTLLNCDLTNMTVGGDGGDTGSGLKRMRPVVSKQLDTNIETRYESVQSTKEYGFLPNKVVAVCKGKNISHKNHIFRYENEEFLNLKSKAAKEIVAIHKLSKEIFEFRTINEAELKLGICKHSISTALNGRTTCRKYTFFLKKDCDPIVLDIEGS